MKLNPYLHFQGNAEEALNFYATALNGTISSLERYGDSPMSSDEDYKQKILPFGSYYIRRFSFKFFQQNIRSNKNVDGGIKKAGSEAE